MNLALQAQTAAHYDEAESLYRTALSIEPNSFDALHMLGVIQLQKGNVEESCRLLISALHHQPSDYSPYYQNLGLALAAVAKARGIGASAPISEHEKASQHLLRRQALHSIPEEPPKVSIVAPCYNHSRYVAEGIASIASQTYKNLEFVIIDDGSKDDSASVIRKACSSLPFPHRFVHRENRGAHATLNEAIGMSTGSYVGILNTDDSYTPERVELMVRSLLSSGTRWGFSNLRFMDETGGIIRYGSQPRVDVLMKSHDHLHSYQTVSESFMCCNTAVTTGNMFFEKSLWQEVGGFKDYRYNHDWAFCLDAILMAEPFYLDEPTYLYRIHGTNTINENHEMARQEADQILGSWYRMVSDPSLIGNKSLAHVRTNRWQDDLETMSKGAAHLLDKNILMLAATDLGFTPLDW